jgi:hypothetical protein
MTSRRLYRKREGRGSPEWLPGWRRAHRMPCWPWCASSGSCCHAREQVPGVLIYLDLLGTDPQGATLAIPPLATSRLCPRRT